MKVIVKKVYHGMVELRDYQVARAMRDHEDIEVVLRMGLQDKARMIIPYELLHTGVETRKEKSIFNGKIYKLIAFRSKFPKFRNKEIVEHKEQGVLF